MDMAPSFEELKNKALEIGWDDMGVTEASVSEQDVAAYYKWLGEKRHAGMQYMENTMRCDPKSLLPGSKSAIIFISYYKQEQEKFSPTSGLIASYARGRDYHNVHRKRLKRYIRWLEERTGQTNNCKGFSDSSPIMEKALAVKAGLGWLGKNTLLIHRRFGTFTLLSGLLTTLDLPQELKPVHLPRCGSCTRCIDACPTAALTSPYNLDAARCLSYHLIESKNKLPQEIKEKNPGYVFGCDICQDACPHNMRKPLSESREFSPEAGIGTYLTLEKLAQAADDPAYFYGTPLQRRGHKGLIENLS